ncbi:MAG: DEAD/DEAH box helicase [Verrucomicrobiota bacterium]|nr:DEAD/DEAH box helicase [Verrucomicrobiota bacterium]
MPYRGPKRVYSRKALESWFERLEDTWEECYGVEELEKGRELYVNGDVREIEMTDHDAIVHARMDRADCYVMIEWSNGKPTVRCSMADKSFGYALAIAGLYEIEELVADECSGLDPLDLKGLGTITPVTPQKKDVEQEDNRPARPLTVKLTTTADGILMVALWDDIAHGLVPALGDAAEKGPPITSNEREKLIRLTRRAHQSGFTFQGKSGSYLLRDILQIPLFLKNELPTWKRYFIMRTDEKLMHLAKGLQIVSAEVEAYSSEKGMSLRWRLKSGERMLSDSEATLVLKAGPRPTLIPSLGMLKLSEEQADFLHNWQPFLRQNGDGTLPHYMLFSLFGQNGAVVKLTPDLSAWRDALMHPPSPNGHLPGFLRPYQKHGVVWLKHLAQNGCHALLADEMGLGKTVQVLALLANAHPMPDKPHLIVCPASVVPVWQREVQRFFPEIKVEVLKSGHDFSTHPSACLWLASYTQLRRHRVHLDKVEFGYTVLDEAQFIKNPDSKVSQACMAVNAKHRLVLTGTPLENRHLDLWTLFRFLMPGLLGGRRQLTDHVIRDPVALSERLRKQIAPFVLRRTKREVLSELPPKVETTLICPLTPIQAREYSRLANQGMAALGDNVASAVREKAISLFTLLTRLRQACCDPHLLPWMQTPTESSGKLNLLREKLREVLESGHKVVVFSQFVSLLKRAEGALRSDFPSIPIFELTGQTHDRAAPVEGFQTCMGAAIMLASLRAAGTGITLHAADYVFLLDPWWNPAVEAQAVDRVHRIGQNRTVFVYRMVTQGTIEERIEALKVSKKALFDDVLHGLAGDGNLERHFHSLRDLIALTDQPEEESASAMGDPQGDLHDESVDGVELAQSSLPQAITLSDPVNNIPAPSAVQKD